MLDQPDERDHPTEFWEEQAAEDRGILARHIGRWTLAFSAIGAILLFALWWSSQAIQFSSSRVAQTTAPTYRIAAVAHDAVTGAPVAWIYVFDDPDGTPPRFSARGDHQGNFELLTIAEPHLVHFSAFGYLPASERIGRRWYRWLPKGEEKLNISLQPELKREN